MISTKIENKLIQYVKGSCEWVINKLRGLLICIFNYAATNYYLLTDKLTIIPITVAFISNETHYWYLHIIKMWQISYSVISSRYCHIRK